MGRSKSSVYWHKIQTQYFKLTNSRIEDFHRSIQFVNDTIVIKINGHRWVYDIDKFKPSKAAKDIIEYKKTLFSETDIGYYF